MADVFSAEVRSKIMSKIRGKNTTPELLLRKELHQLGIRYSLKRRFKEIRCSPDIVMCSRRIAIFVDGCFWHACPKCFSAPKSNKQFWDEKIGKNISRDRRQTEKLKELGWSVIRVWEHQIKADPKKTALQIVKTI